MYNKLQLEVAYANLLSQLFVPASLRVQIGANPDRQQIPVLLTNELKQYESELESSIADFNKDIVEDQTEVDWLHSNLNTRPRGAQWQRAAHDRDKEYNPNNYTHWRLVEVSNEESIDDYDDDPFFDD